MAYSISGSVGSWQSGARNNSADVRTVQTLLTEAAKKLGKREFDPQGIDGKISRAAGASSTVKAIIAFQRQKVGFASPDGKVDPGGKTWKALIQVVGPAPAAVAVVPGATFTVTFQHGGKIPTGTHYKTATAATHSGLYESAVTVSGGASGTFRGSIYPDDMWVKGRLKDGSYPLHIGFHKGGGGAKQGADQLVVKTQGIRAALLVNARQPVDVLSENSAKTTSVGVNVHNGFNSKRYSDGCPTIQPSDWEKFIRIFLSAFPNIEDWHAVGNNTGKKIGTLVVKT